MSHIPTTTLPFPELASTLPLQDVVALGGLVGVRQVQTWTRDKIAEYKRHLTTLITIQNSIAPINTLPNELLMKIFTKISGLWWYHARWMVSLGHVSRRWRAVLLATPEYWAQGLEDCLDAENDEGRNHLLSLFVERSSPCPLQLDMWNASSDADYYGWKAFKGHWWRLDDLEVSVGSENELFKILRRISKLKRLERLQLEVDCEVSTQDLDQWKAKSHPYLGCLEISSPVFCRATTVPSLHTLILFKEPRDPDSPPGLLDALQRCPALATLRVEFEWMDTRTQPVSTQLDRRMLDLPNLRHLRVAGRVADIYSFLSCISFPASAAQIELVVRDAHDALRSVLPDILPTRLSILHMSPRIDRLFLQSDVEYSTAVPFVSMRGYVRGAERLQVSPVLWLDGAARFLQFLDVFGACTVAELALDLRRVISDMDGEFWRRFFAALPDLRRLELLSCNVESRETKRAIAEHFLASCRGPQQAEHAISLAWALRADEGREGNPSQLEDELSDIQQVLGGHAREGARLERLELYATSLEPHSCRPEYDHPQVVDIKQVGLDRTAKWLLNRDIVSRLADAAEVVTAGGQLGLPTDDDSEDSEYEVEGDGPDRDDAHEDKDEDEESGAGSSNDT